MESSIAEFLSRKLACELLPTRKHICAVHMYRLISREAHLTKASALLRLDAVICCVAVCYHIVYGCLAGWPLRVHTPRLIPPSMPAVLAFCDHQVAYIKFLTMTSFSCLVSSHGKQSCASQRSLHNAPIFRLLLKVAVNGTHQCDFLNFCGYLGTQQHTYIQKATVNTVLLTSCRSYAKRACARAPV